MIRTRWTRALPALAAVMALPLSTLTLTPAQADPSSPTEAARAVGVGVEAARVDRVPTPRLGWYDCYEWAQCATVDLPLDYDQPHGAKVEVAVLRVRATDPARRIGSLFVNPGGPGGSGTQIAYFAPFIFPKLLERFDVVGIDPRGTNFSDQVKCFTGPAQQSKALEGLLGTAFPVTKAEEAAAVASARAMGKGCSTTGRPLSGAMSTAQVARDMDVVRRAVGDSKLSFLGFSYGSYLGQVYANMFPGRVRAVAIDGVLDPIAWRGTRATAHRPQTDRLRSADGAYKALRELLERCDAAGVRRCSFAKGDPVRKYDVVAERLKKDPLVVDGGPAGPWEFGYDDLVANTLGILYSPEPGEMLAELMTFLEQATAPAADRAVTAAARAAAGAQVRRLVAELTEQQAARRGWDFPYDNSFEAFATVLCTDGLNPWNAWKWSRAADAADRRAPYFGRLWTWASVQCAREAWTVRDEDAYRGPFTRHTAAPVLVVGNYWDPATNYQGAVTAARLLPNSRLLSSDNWGHTAYGTSGCATRAIDAYLLTQRLPAKGTLCHGPQPFTGEGRRSDAARQLPPVAPPLPPRPVMTSS